MTLARKVTFLIILAIVTAGAASCLIHWVNERRAAHRTLEVEARWLARICDGQVALLNGERDPLGRARPPLAARPSAASGGSAPNDRLALPARIQTIINFACRWRPEILRFAYYSYETEGPAAGSLRLVASLQPIVPADTPPALANEAFTKDRVIVKRRYHDEDPHVAVYAPLHDQKKPHGVVVVKLSPARLMIGVRASEQDMINMTLLVGFLTILLLTLIMRLMIVGRVEALTQAAQLGSGKEIERLGGTRATDEFARLAQQINHMFRSVLSRNGVWERLYSASVQEEGGLAAESHEEIENAADLAMRDRIKRELEIANRIQRSLLPESFPTGHGLTFAVRYSPAGQVGGDLYDFVVVDPNLLGIMIADVAGHGIPAAFVAGMTKIAFTQFSVQNPSPAAVVSAINEYLHTHLRTGHYVTIFYGVFNRATKTFRFVRAGHQTPFIIRKGSNVLEPLEVGGPLVGAEANVKFEESEVTLREGDKVVMFTDGLADCKNDHGARIGQAGLRELLKEYGSKSAEATAADIFRKSADFRGSVPPDDDITILVAEVRNGA